MNPLLKQCDSYTLSGKLRVSRGYNYTAGGHAGWIVWGDYIPNWGCDCCPQTVWVVKPTWREAIDAAWVIVRGQMVEETAA
jgi:hypothetical protein